MEPVHPRRGLGAADRGALVRDVADDLPAAWGAEWVPVDVVHELAAVQVVDSLDLILRDMVGAVPERAWSRARMEATAPAIAGELGCSPGDAA